VAGEDDEPISKSVTEADLAKAQAAAAAGSTGGSSDGDNLSERSTPQTSPRNATDAAGLSGLQVQCCSPRCVWHNAVSTSQSGVSLTACWQERAARERNIESLITWLVFCQQRMEAQPRRRWPRALAGSVPALPTCWAILAPPRLPTWTLPRVRVPACCSAALVHELLTTAGFCLHVVHHACAALIFRLVIRSTSVPTAALAAHADDGAVNSGIGASAVGILAAAVSDSPRSTARRNLSALARASPLAPLHPDSLQPKQQAKPKPQLQAQCDTTVQSLPASKPAAPAAAKPVREIAAPATSWRLPCHERWEVAGTSLGLSSSVPVIAGCGAHAASARLGCTAAKLGGGGGAWPPAGQRRRHSSCQAVCGDYRAR
jgi:hypothetical protein